MSLSTEELKTNVVGYTKIYEDPYVETIDNFINNEDCLHFINLANGRLKQALVSHGRKGEVSSGRTGKNCWIGHNHDEVTTRISKRVADHVNLPIVNAEAFQVIYYDVSQEYRNHCDGWPHDLSEKSRRCMRMGGQRMKTALCYLNTVEKGGETRFTKLNIDVKPKAGRLLVFHNTYKGTNKRHPLSEHAGCPVIAGEKWAFNLWFREDDFKKVVYDPPRSTFTSVSYKALNEDGNAVEITDLTNTKIGTTYNISIKSYENVIAHADLERLEEDIKFENNSSKATVWIPTSSHKKFINRIAQITGESFNNFETMCAIQYPGGHVHSPHFDCFDDTKQNSKVVSEKMGQRVKTISGFLYKGLNYNFVNNRLNYTPEAGSLLVYENVKPGSTTRERNALKKITNLTNDPLVVFHIYVRQRSRYSDYTPPLLRVKPPPPPTTSESNGGRLLGDGTEAYVPQDNAGLEMPNYYNGTYGNTLLSTYERFQNKTISKMGFKSLSFCNIRTGWDDVTNTVMTLKNMRSEKNGIVNLEKLKNTYKFDEFTPVIVENSIIPQAVELISKYYNNGIEKNQFPFGDRQSKRFKTRNDPVARILHYELLPLIERVTGENLRPTYTYLSCYVKGSDLPQHTDNPDCWRTVSYLIDKPEGSNWPIYYDPVKQKKKHAGRCFAAQIPKDRCIPCDCEKGGFMCFDGTDHLHFREALPGKYYYLLLLHYKTISQK